MNERLLQYIWLHRFYDSKHLITEDHQSLSVIFQGIHNKDQGPDFLHARIRLNQIELVGSVEIHIRTSQWNQHGHNGDHHYKNVILHVVWEHDIPFDLSIPVVCLKGSVSSMFLHQYAEWMGKKTFLPCGSQLHLVPKIIMNQWKERMLAERLLFKVGWVENVIYEKKYDDEQIFWRMLFRCMGAPVNAEAFEILFESVPFKVWLKCRDRIQVLEALMFGQVNLLNDSFQEDYAVMLQKEYRFLLRKFGIKPPSLLLSFLRMRPANFPAVRLAQLAMLMHAHPDLFTNLMKCSTVSDMKKNLKVTPNDFWHYHYSLNVFSEYKIKQLGEGMLNAILINVVFPFRFLIAKRIGNNEQQMLAMEFYAQIKAEENAITRIWKRAGVEVQNACDSQSLLHLYKSYCAQKHCLDCAAGRTLLR